MKPVGILLVLVACRADSGATPLHAAVDGSTVGMPSVDGVAAAERLDEARPSPPAGERVALIPAEMKGYGELYAPPAVVGRPPSSAHPEGTLFVSAYRGLPEHSPVSPYVAEWDLAHEKVIAAWSDVHSGEFRKIFAPISFDGSRLFVLSEWDDKPDAAGKPRTHCRLDVLDEKMRSARKRRVPCGQDVVSRPGGKVAIVSYGWSEADARTITLHLLDRALRPRVSATWPAPKAPLFGDSRVVHAGDSFYAMVLDAEGHARLLRAGDEDLEERGRSPSFGPGDTPGVFSPADDHWLVSLGSQRWKVSARLERVELLQEDEALLLGSDGPEAWQGKRYLAYPQQPGSYVHQMCTPQWAFGNPVFACASSDQLAVVRPVLDSVPRVELVPMVRP